MDKPLLLFLFALLLLASPLVEWWAAGGSWYRPFLLWGAVIAAALWLERRGGDHEP